MRSTDIAKEYVTVSQFSRLCEEVQANTELTQVVHKNTADLVAAFNAARGAFKTLEVLGRIFKPIVVISGFIATAWGSWQTFKGH